MLGAGCVPWCWVPVPSARCTRNFVADTPARSTRSAVTSYPDTARLPSARFKLVERQTGIEQGAEHHVAGNAGEAIEIENTGHRLDIARVLSSQLLEFVIRIDSN